MPVDQSLFEFPRAYLITFRTYGSWLHGTEGSVDRQHNRPETDFPPTDSNREAAMQQRMASDVFTLNTPQRSIVQDAITSVCQHRGWELLAINVRTNHVHAVVTASALPEKAMNDFKAWATRNLRKASLINTDQKVWSRHDSTRYLWDEQAIEEACRYVLAGQGVYLE